MCWSVLKSVAMRHSPLMLLLMILATALTLERLICSVSLSALRMAFSAALPVEFRLRESRAATSS